MKLNGDERLKTLTAAGGIRCDVKDFAILPVTLADFGTDPIRCQISVYRPEDLVRIIMPDDSMAPLIAPGEELTVAYRSKAEDGDLAAVMIPGTDQPFTVREISYGEYDLWLIPGNKEYAVDCCDPERIEILGKIVEGQK